GGVEVTGGRRVCRRRANFNGSQSFTFQVQEHGGAANGGVNLDPTPNPMTISVTSVNDAPSGTDNTVTTLEDHAYTFGAADFGFKIGRASCRERGENSVAAVEVKTNKTGGTLGEKGVWVTAGDSVAAGDVAAQ